MTFDMFSFTADLAGDEAARLQSLVISRMHGGVVVYVEVIK